MCYISNEEYGLKIPGKPYDNLRTYRHSNVQSCLITWTKLVFSFFGFKIMCMDTIRLGEHDWHWRRCGLPTIPTYGLLQVYLVWWWLACGSHTIISLRTEARRRTWVLGCFQKNPRSCLTTCIQTFRQMVFWGTYHFGVHFQEGKKCLFVGDEPVSRLNQVP